jgi:hypothetical protein
MARELCLRRAMDFKQLPAHNGSSTIDRRRGSHVVVETCSLIL